MKLQSLTIIATSLVCICAQRPFYAGGGQYPGVLPQNLPNTTDLDQRFNENSTTNSYKPYEKDPMYNVEKELVDRIKNEYPKDKQPFWYVNAAQINNTKYPQQPSQTQSQQLPQTQSQQQLPQTQSQQLSQMQSQQQEILSLQQENIRLQQQQQFQQQQLQQLQQQLQQLQQQQQQRPQQGQRQQQRQPSRN